VGDTQKHTQEPWMLVGEKTPHIASFVQNRGDICDLYHKRDDQRGLYIKENAEANGLVKDLLRASTAQAMKR